MRMILGLATIAGGLLATAAGAQSAPPPPPPPPPGGGWMRADANHDGVITRAEAIAEADARFAAMDADKDGKVTAQEREAARQAMRGGSAGGGFGRHGGGPDGDAVLTRAEAEARAAARFDRADTNHDGRLDAAEIAAARPMRGPRRGGEMPPPPAPAASPIPSDQ